ncbi:dihydrolipoamide acetyltransferase family protein [Chelatococcus sp. SYSU_G07232]|uniref:Dihydrolipoamide acetyltransferase component of pyruvate dehydrogenase complex n=1 Tax=Chelatococcus albus TaxID=3047466 RepID=A0ABT7AFA6_9HYPH|nr:dihydrolipoamide acetyltransferase family protein [Chelatococcus sp. SYSU_G07232]MDJ1158054.1 dihydrolipoamide acetyltransferase family protein [Chelatococcus sp. SYSU_G07232]
MNEFRLPDLGEGLQEAEIVAWHVTAGDHVVTDQPLVAVETEKAVVEIPSPRSGRIAELLARPGERVQVGAPLLVFETEGTSRETGTVVGELAPAEPAPAAPRGTAPQTTPAAGPAPGRAPVRAAPAVRARAKALGVDLTRVTPSGTDGTVTLADVEAASGGLAKVGEGERETTGEALRSARRTMALNMARAGREVVPATLMDDADIEGWRPDEDVTVRLIRAILAGCEAEPALNARFDGASLAVHPNPRLDLGIAVDDPEGLFVPVLRDVGGDDAAGWRRRIDALKAAVRDRSLSPADLRGATFTLSNFGTIAGRHATLVVVPPQVAILGAGRTVDRPVRSGGGIVLRRMLPLSLTFDHRAITGGEAARFLRAVIADLERMG